MKPEITGSQYLDSLPDVIWHEPRCNGAYPSAMFFSQIAAPFVRKFVAIQAKLSLDVVNLGVRCVYCKRVKDHWTGPAELPNVPSGKIKNSRWMFDPDEDHFCHTYWPPDKVTEIQRSKVIVEDITRRKCHEARDLESTPTPADVYNDICATIRLEYPLEAQYLIETSMPDHRSMRKALANNLRAAAARDECENSASSSRAANNNVPSYSSAYNPFSAVPPHSQSQTPNQPRSSISTSNSHKRPMYVSLSGINAKKRRLEMAQNASTNKRKQDLECQLAESQLYESQFRAYKLEKELNLPHRVDLLQMNNEMTQSNTSATVRPEQNGHDFNF